METLRSLYVTIVQIFLQSSLACFTELGSCRTLAGNNLAGELSRGIENLQDRLAYLTLGLQVTCDCNLLEWYPAFIRGSGFNERDNIATCSAINEYHGVYAHLLRSEAKAPCSHPTFTSNPVSAEPRSIEVEISYEEDYTVTKAEEFSQLNWSLRQPTSTAEFGEENAKLFAECALFKTPTAFVQTVVAGFELQWHPAGRPEEVKRLCSLDKANTIKGLEPFSTYSVFGRAFLLYFSQTDGDTEISYVYGPQTAGFRVETKASPPTGYVMNLRAFQREAKRIGLIWDEVPEGQQNGEIIDYKVNVIGDRVNTFYFEHRQFAFVDDLEPEENYKFVVTARNIEGVGPPSPEVEIETCEINGKWNNSVESDRCFAVAGSYELAAGVFASCADLTRHYPALQVS